jgi:hypothetical protein
MTVPPHNAHGHLPEGHHHATLSEVETHFAYNVRRREIFRGLTQVLKMLSDHGVSDVYLDGSFVTTKLRPSDVDVVFIPSATADPSAWGILALSRRKELKALHRVDLWPWPSLQPDPSAPSGRQTILQYFCNDRDDHPKGTILLEDLGT